MAAAFGPYWLNAETFLEATGVWDDSALTTCADEGYYSNGVIQRYLEYDAGTGQCCLGPALTCPSCIPAPIDCTDSIPPPSGQDQQGYVTDVSFGNSVGVGFAYLNPIGAPDAMAVEYPAGSGQYITEGITDNAGWVSNNIATTAAVTTGMWDYAIWVGDSGNYDDDFLGTSGIIGLSAGAHCEDASGDSYEAIGAWPASSGLGLTMYTLNNAGSGWIIDPVQPTTPPDPLLTTLNFASNVGQVWNPITLTSYYPDTTVQGNFLGIDESGVLVPNSSTAAGADQLCDVNTDLFIAIPKNNPAFVNVRVMWVGGTGTAFNGDVYCPKPPTQFSYESATVVSNVDPAWTPACDTAGSGPFDASFWMASPFEANSTNPTAELTVRGFCYVTATPSSTDARLNEGAGTFTWYRVNMMDQPVPSTYNNHGPGAEAHTPGMFGPQREDYLGTNVTSVWVQVDTHGIITRIESCEVTN